MDNETDTQVKEKPVLYRVVHNHSVNGMISPERFWSRAAVSKEELPKFLEAGWVRSKSSKYDGQFGKEAENFTIL